MDHEDGGDSKARGGGWPVFFTWNTVWCQSNDGREVRRCVLCLALRLCGGFSKEGSETRDLAGWAIQ